MNAYSTILVADRATSTILSLKRSLKALSVTRQIEILLETVRSKDFNDLDGDEMDRVEGALCSLLSESREKDFHQDRALHGREVAA